MRRPGGTTVGAVIFAGVALASSPARAGDDDPRYVPVARFGMGTAVSDAGATLAIPVGAGFTAFDRREEIGVVYGAEVGTWLAFLHPQTYLFTATVGVGFGNQMVALTYQPRFLIGERRDEYALGMRNSLVGRFFYDAINVEVGHQFLVTQEHDLYRDQFVFEVSVNMVGVFVGLFDQLAGIGGGG
ncbi:MAG: hypothetical protein U0271_28150 [Polyangiaceae bacterium]